MRPSLTKYLFSVIVLCITIKASAHNAVSYISEEAIAVSFLVGIVLVISLVCTVLGLFKTHAFIRVFSIIGAVLSTLFLGFVTSVRGFDYFIPSLLVSTVLFWLTIYFRKKKVASTSKPSALKVGFLESLSFLAASMIIIWNVHIITKDQEVRSTIIFSLYFLVASLIIYFGHKHHYKRLLKSNKIPQLLDGLKVTGFSILIFSLFMIVHTLLHGLANDFGYFSVGQVVKLLCIGATPVFIVGAVISWVLIPKTTPKPTEETE